MIQIFGGSTRKLEMIHITNYTSAIKSAEVFESEWMFNIWVILSFAKDNFRSNVCILTILFAMSNNQSYSLKTNFTKPKVKF